MPRSPFITPSAPVLKAEPPTGADWIHELKHDGWRAQLHLRHGETTIYSRNGADITRRFRSIADALKLLPVRAAILDAEIIACDADGTPSFNALMKGAPHGCCAYCFDLLALDDQSLLDRPLNYRRARLQKLLARAQGGTLRFSEAFSDPIELLEACARHGYEGIVSKRKSDTYLPGSNPSWIKVKTAPWREANRERWKFFQK